MFDALVFDGSFEDGESYNNLEICNVYKSLEEEGKLCISQWCTQKNIQKLFHEVFEAVKLIMAMDDINLLNMPTLYFNVFWRIYIKYESKERWVIYTL